MENAPLLHFEGVKAQDAALSVEGTKADILPMMSRDLERLIEHVCVEGDEDMLKSIMDAMDRIVASLRSTTLSRMRECPARVAFPQENGVTGGRAAQSDARLPGGGRGFGTHSVRITSMKDNEEEPGTMVEAGPAAGVCAGDRWLADASDSSGKGACADDPILPRFFTIVISYHAYFKDPDGYFWEVVWGPDFSFDEDGPLVFCDRVEAVA